MRTLGAVSVVVPTFNEAENVSLLLDRLDATFKTAHLTYQIIFIDDHSTDGTVALLQTLQSKYPLEVHLKKGKRGKAFSLMEGFRFVKYDAVCMIDADLQYPPEAIVSMYELMCNNQADIILSRRVDNATGWMRKLATATYNAIFTRLLFGFDYDTQSGLKLFDRKILGNIKVSPSPWSFDLEFIVRSMERHYSILSYDIPFAERHAGEAKVSIISTSFELAWAALKLRVDTSIKDVRRAYRRDTKLAEKVFGVFVASLLTLLTLHVRSADAATVDTGLLSVNVSDILQPQANSQQSADTINMQPATASAADASADPSLPQVSDQTGIQPASDAATAITTPASPEAARLAVKQQNYGKTTPTALPSANAYVALPKPDTKGVSKASVVLIGLGTVLLAIATAWYFARRIKTIKALS
ncbi:MAG: glycosyl transferase family 2 [Candidatus Saccharibacteria bacterium]|nr:glycosyl transferase family 2 [Candidatus Saccharibacteria bacterium]